MNAPTETPRLLSIQEAARALGVSERLVWSALSRGELPSVRLGRRRLIDSADLSGFIESRKTGGGAQR